MRERLMFIVLLTLLAGVTFFSVVSWHIHLEKPHDDAVLKSAVGDSINVYIERHIEQYHR